MSSKGYGLRVKRVYIYASSQLGISENTCVADRLSYNWPIRARSERANLLQTLAAAAAATKRLCVEIQRRKYFSLLVRCPYTAGPLMRADQDRLECGMYFLLSSVVTWPKVCCDSNGGRRECVDISVSDISMSENEYVQLGHSAPAISLASELKSRWK